MKNPLSSSGERSGETKEVADHFDYHLQTARRLLKALHEQGDLRQKDVGKRFVWWLPGIEPPGSATVGRNRPISVADVPRVDTRGNHRSGGESVVEAISTLYFGWG